MALVKYAMMMTFTGEIVAKKEKMFKVNRAYFKRFKDSFLYWQKKFGLMEYRVYFLQEFLDDNYAEIRTNIEGKLAHVVLNTEWDKDDVATDDGPEDHAKHEAVHLLLARLAWLGRSRYICDTDINEEDEAVVVRLARILK